MPSEIGNRGVYVLVRHFDLGQKCVVKHPYLSIANRCIAIDERVVPRLQNNRVVSPLLNCIQCHDNYGACWSCTPAKHYMEMQ